MIFSHFVMNFHLLTYHGFPYSLPMYQLAHAVQGRSVVPYILSKLFPLKSFDQFHDCHRSFKLELHIIIRLVRNPFHTRIAKILDHQFKYDQFLH